MIGRETTKMTFGAALLAALIGWALPGGVGAQETDARWLPWLGCWETAAEGPGVARAGGAMLCVRPVDGEVGVEFLTVTDGRIRSAERVRADGARYESAREGCDGWRRAEFSDDATRVYRFTRYVCDGDVPRSSSGLMSMISPSRWIDVEVVDIDGEEMAMVQRYRPAAAERAAAAGFGAIADDRAMSQQAARVRASRRVAVDDVIEATSKVSPEAVRVWLAERAQRLDLDAEALVRMDESGVPGDVIDVVVAVSYPEHFDLGAGARVTEAEDRYASARRDPYAYGRRYYDPFYLDPFYYRSRFAPFGYYGRLGGFGFFPGYVPTVVVVDDEGDRGGRWVKGRGFRRNPSGSGGSGIRDRARPRNPGVSARGGGSRGGSSSVITRSGAKRRGGSSTGRKAKKKGGSGGSGGGSGSGGGGGGLL